MLVIISYWLIGIGILGLFLSGCFKNHKEDRP